MKNKNTILAVVLLLGMTNSFAASNFPMANGTISSTNKIGSISLAMIQNQPNFYDITCLITGTNTDKSAASFQALLTLPSSVAGFVPYFMYYDGENISSNGISSKGLVINDIKTHKLTVSVYGASITPNATFDLSWSNGDTSSAVDYSCSATQKAANARQ
jgi:hypothetical protein